MTLNEIKSKASKIDCYQSMLSNAMEFDVSSLSKKEIEKLQYQNYLKDGKKNLKEYSSRTKASD